MWAAGGRRENEQEVDFFFFFFFSFPRCSSRNSIQEQEVCLGTEHLAGATVFLLLSTCDWWSGSRGSYVVVLFCFLDTSWNWIQSGSSLSRHLLFIVQQPNQVVTF